MRDQLLADARKLIDEISKSCPVTGARLLVVLKSLTNLCAVSTDKADVFNEAALVIDQALIHCLVRSVEIKKLQYLLADGLGVKCGGT